MSIIEGLFPPHVLRAVPPLPTRLSHEPDGLTSVPLEPGECLGPATIQPIHRRQLFTSQLVDELIGYVITGYDRAGKPFATQWVPTEDEQDARYQAKCFALEHSSRCALRFRGVQVGEWCADGTESGN